MDSAGSADSADIFVVVDMAEAIDAGFSTRARLIGRIVTEPNLQAQELLRCQHSEVRLAFVEAFQRALPAHHSLISCGATPCRTSPTCRCC